MSQSLSNVLVHLVFSTKERFPFLRNPDIRDRMHRYVAGIFNALGSQAIEVGGTADHVHVLCSLNRSRSIAEVVREAKANSSRWAKTLDPSFAKFEWQGGYGAFSVHPSQACATQKYIRNQAEHHRTRTFQDEFLIFLREYGVPYDERYIWT